MRLHVRHVALLVVVGLLSLVYNVFYLVTQLEQLQDSNMNGYDHHSVQTAGGPPVPNRALEHWKVTHLRLKKNTNLELSDFQRADSGDIVPKAKEQQDVKGQAKVPSNKNKENNQGHGPQPLSCQAYGGPSDEQIAEMIYWRDDIPDELQFQSSYGPAAADTTDSKQEQFLVFRPDWAGFSNVRLAFETVVSLAKATGRTLVLPPKMRFSQLMAGIGPDGKPNTYYLQDFFHITGLPIIQFEDYLKQEALTGHLRGDSSNASHVYFPPDNNRTNWTDLTGNSNAAGGEGDAEILWENFLSPAMLNVDWHRDECFVAFSADLQNHSDAHIQANFDAIINDDAAKHVVPYWRTVQYNGKPIPVDSSRQDRLREMVAERQKMCSYNETMRKADHLFITGVEKTNDSHARPLVQFYAYFFFDDWHQDLAMKRFVRDHLRFADTLQCAAARIVSQLRAAARRNGTPDGSFDSAHFRRGDFVDIGGYKDGVVSADQIVESQFFQEGRTVYVATDEQDKKFFEPMSKHYKVLFLSDFMDQLEGMDPNFFGMIEQLVIARGDTFVGTYFSTFTAYANRIRGYHALKNRLPMHEQGAINSEYMGHGGSYRDMLKRYSAVTGGPWKQEWPSAWRDIDHDVP